MKDIHLREFRHFIREEIKEYVCVCGDYSMKAKKIEIIDDYEANVIIECYRCQHQRKTNIYYTD